MSIRKENQDVNQKGKSASKPTGPLSAPVQAEQRHHTQAPPPCLPEGQGLCQTDTSRLSSRFYTTNPSFREAPGSQGQQQAEQNFLLWWEMSLSEVLLIITNTCYLKIYIPISYRNSCCQFIRDSCINQTPRWLPEDCSSPWGAAHGEAMAALCLQSRSLEEH